MSMIEPRFRDIYKNFYKQTYYTPTALDPRTKELVAIGVSLALQCEGCAEGHIQEGSSTGCHERGDQRLDRHCGWDCRRQRGGQ